MRGTWLSLRLVVLAAAACGHVVAVPEQDAASAPSPVLELLAGDVGGSGNGDGTGPIARFGGPGSVAVDAAGNVYVADFGNDTIRRVTPAGVVTTLAGAAGLTGGADGLGPDARFNNPGGVALDSAGNVYVADFGNDTIRKVTPTGGVTTLAGTAGMAGSADGTGAAARFSNPRDVALDSAGNVYVADFTNGTIRKVTPTGVVTTLVSSAGGAAQFSFPAGVAVDSQGNLYVADMSDAIHKITPTGVVTTFAGTAGMPGSTDGTGPNARFNGPGGVRMDSGGNIYVADTGNSTIRKVTPAGVVTTLAGVAGTTGSDDGGAAARFNHPQGIAVDSTGNAYVADTSNNTVRRVTSAGVVTTLAGAAPLSGSTDGTGSAARFNGTRGVVVGSAGDFYVADSGNNTIRRITPGGVVTTLAGTVGVAGSADGIGGSAQFNDPIGIAMDSGGSLYVADFLNDTIRKITLDGAVTTLAGVAGIGGSADGGPSARFAHPAGVAVDTTSNVYVADNVNQTIRKVTPAGLVTTLAGAAGMIGSADGGAAARFNFPNGIAVDNAGNLYVVDNLNDTIRKVTPMGVVTTLAGAPSTPGSADGAGPTARFNKPRAVAVDAAGIVYVADAGNSTIRKITPTGVTTTIGGISGTSGIVLGAAPRFSSPAGLGIVGDSLVISDTNAVLLLRHVIAQ